MKPAQYAPEEREKRDVTVLSFIDSFIETNGYSPSLDDIAPALPDYEGKPSSTSVVASTLRRLTYNEYLTATAGIRRSLRVTDEGKAWLARKNGTQPAP